MLKKDQFEFRYRRCTACFEQVDQRHHLLDIRLVADHDQPSIRQDLDLDLPLQSTQDRLGRLKVVPGLICDGRLPGTRGLRLDLGLPFALDLGLPLALNLGLPLALNLGLPLALGFRLSLGLGLLALCQLRQNPDSWGGTRPVIDKALDHRTDLRGNILAVFLGLANTELRLLVPVGHVQQPDHPDQGH